jgi:hypothetical protein
MPRLARFAWLFPLLAAGCALNAVRPPTPAATLTVDSGEPPPPGERFFVLVWAAQRSVRLPRSSHTWVTVVRAAVPCPGRAEILEAHTISWLPATLDIRVLACRPEPGVNLTLDETLSFAAYNGARVSLWGPFECRASFYRRFLVQKQFLETSGIGYHAVDNLGEAARTGDACCCIHGVTDTDPEFGRANYPLIWYGDSASEHVANRLREDATILNPETEHDEVFAAMGLEGRAIRRRHFDDRLIDLPRIQPARTPLAGLRGEPRQAPPYPAPPFPPPGPRGP